MKNVCAIDLSTIENDPLEVLRGKKRQNGHLPQSAVNKSALTLIYGGNGNPAKGGGHQPPSNNQPNNSIWFQRSLLAGCPELKNLVDQIFNTLQIKGRNNQSLIKRRTLECILSNALAAHRASAYFIIYRSANRFNSPSRYGFNYFKYKSVVRTLDWLVTNDFLHCKIGNNFKGFASSYWATPKLEGLFIALESAALLAGRNRRFRQMKRIEPLILRDNLKRELPYEDSTNSKAMRADLFSYNRFIRTQSVSISLSPLYPINVTTQELRTMGLHNPLYPSGVIHQGVAHPPNKSFAFSALDLPPFFFELRRIFSNGSFSQGGRHYALFQNLSETRRGMLKINGNDTVELDFSSLHINMLYHAMGIPGPLDPYLMPTFPLLRNLCKRVVNIIINSSNRFAAIGAIQKHLQDPKNVVDVNLLRQSGLTVSTLYQHFITLHQPISGFFNSGWGVNLQFEDSEMVRQILKRITEKGILVLPVHDSFIIEKSYEVDLRNVMQTVYQTAPFNKKKLPIGIKKKS